jgi:hypothetical protein
MRAGEVRRLLVLQTADGWFEGDAAHFSGDAREHLERLVTEWLGADAPAEHVLTTIAVLVRLRSHYPDDRRRWSRAEAKALRWLADAIKRPDDDVDVWLDTIANDPQLSAAPIE